MAGRKKGTRERKAVFRRNVLITRSRCNKARRAENFAGKPLAGAGCKEKGNERRAVEGDGETAEYSGNGRRGKLW